MTNTETKPIEWLDRGQPPLHLGLQVFRYFNLPSATNENLFIVRELLPDGETVIAEGTETGEMLQVVRSPRGGYSTPNESTFFQGKGVLGAAYIDRIKPGDRFRQVTGFAKWRVVTVEKIKMTGTSLQVTDQDGTIYYLNFNRDFQRWQDSTTRQFYMPVSEGTH